MSDLENYEAKTEYEEECLQVVLSNKRLFDNVLDVAFNEEDLSDWLTNYDDISNYVSFDDALRIVEQTDEWWLQTDRQIFDPIEIASLITFENAHEIAYILAMGNDFKIGTALYNELEYYKNIGRI